ncbi:hypothetical protein Tco_0344568 [Tanacetum coccineum]
MLTTRQGLSSAAIEQLIAQRVADAIASYEANLNNINGTQNEASSSAGGLNKVVQEDGIHVHVCNYAESCQVKYATSTLLDSALTWWNSYVKIIGLDTAYETTWEELKKMMTKEDLTSLVTPDAFKNWYNSVPVWSLHNTRKLNVISGDSRKTFRERKMIMEEIRTNNETRGMKWLELMLLNHVKGKDMLELYQSATCVTFIITTVPVPLNVVTAGRSVTKQETARTLLRLRAMNVENKDTPGKSDISSRLVVTFGSTPGVLSRKPELASRGLVTKELRPREVG